MTIRISLDLSNATFAELQHFAAIASTGDFDPDSFQITDNEISLVSLTPDVPTLVPFPMMAPGLFDEDDDDDDYYDGVDDFDGPPFLMGHPPYFFDDEDDENYGDDEDFDFRDPKRFRPGMPHPHEIFPPSGNSGQSSFGAFLDDVLGMRRPSKSIDWGKITDPEARNRFAEDVLGKVDDAIEAFFEKFPGADSGDNHDDHEDHHDSRHAHRKDPRPKSRYRHTDEHEDAAFRRARRGTGRRFDRNKDKSDNDGSPDWDAMRDAYHKFFVNGTGKRKNTDAGTDAKNNNAGSENDNASHCSDTNEDHRNHGDVDASGNPYRPAGSDTSDHDSSDFPTTTTHHNSSDESTAKDHDATDHTSSDDHEPGDHEQPDPNDHNFDDNQDDTNRNETN